MTTNPNREAQGRHSKEVFINGEVNKMGQEMSHSIADDDGEDHAPKKRKRGDDIPPTSTAASSAFATAADNADATKLRQMMDQNLSQMKRMEKIMGAMETRLSRVDYLEDRCKELEERCNHLETTRSNHNHPQTNNNNGTRSNDDNETSTAAMISSAVSSTKKRGRGRPPKEKVPTQDDDASVEKKKKDKSPPTPISNTNTTKAASTSTRKSASLNNVPSASAAATTRSGSVPVPQSKISPNNTTIATAEKERKQHKGKTRRSRDSIGDTTTDSSSSSPLFAVNNDTVSPLSSSVVRPKRKLKAITKFDPSSSSNNQKKSTKHKSPPTGSGFACPNCFHICSYYDASRMCNNCGLECYYEAGVGVVVLKDRDSGVGSSGSSLSPQRRQLQNQKSVGATATALDEWAADSIGKKTAGATNYNEVERSVQVAIISETTAKEETVSNEGEKGTIMAKRAPVALSKTASSDDANNDSANDTTTAATMKKTDKNGTATATTTTTKKPEKGRTAKTTAIIASSRGGDKTTTTTTLESTIPKRKRGRPRKSMEEVGNDGSISISQTTIQQTKSKEDKALVKVVPRRTRSKSLNR